MIIDAGDDDAKFPKSMLKLSPQGIRMRLLHIGRRAKESALATVELDCSAY